MRNARPQLREVGESDNPEPVTGIVYLTMFGSAFFESAQFGRFMIEYRSKTGCTCLGLGLSQRGESAR